MTSAVDVQAVYNAAASRKMRAYASALLDADNHVVQIGRTTTDDDQTVNSRFLPWNVPQQRACTTSGQSRMFVFTL